MFDDDLQQELDKTISSLDYLRQQKKKNLDKIFSLLVSRTSLGEVLDTYSKVDLDTVRKALDIPGLSSLSKPKLVVALENKIQEILPSIIGILTEREYKVLNRLIRNNGIIKFTSEIEDEFLYLRKLGIVGALTDEKGCRSIFIPQDIENHISALCSDLKVVSNIKRNGKVNKILKGLLYYYGVLETGAANDFINKYFAEPISNDILSKILVQNFYKEYGLGFESIYWCHNEVFSPDEIIEEQNNNTELDYLPFTIAEVLAAAEENFRMWGKFERLLLNFLTGTFDISRMEAEEFIESLKMDFKSGNDFNEIVHELSHSFDMSDDDQVQYMTGLLRNIYNVTGQWFLKGYSPQDLGLKK